MRRLAALLALTAAAVVSAIVWIARWGWYPG
jgi:hypothetical protein